MSDGIRGVVEAACRLKGWERAAVIETEGLSRHFASSFKGAMELDWSDRQARRAVVAQLVADARVALALATRALRGFSKGAEPTRALRKAQRLLAELLVQDIDEQPEDGAGPEIRRGTARDRIVSTTDPEMRHGHKSHSKGFEGYKAALVVDTDRGVILATDVRAGNAHDGEGAAERVAEAAERSGQELREILGDTAYGGLETRKELEALGAEVIAKAPPGTRKGMFNAMDFRVDRRRGLATCPAGKTSIRRHAVRGEDPGFRCAFSRRDCRPCPLRARCTKSHNAARSLRVTAKTEQLWKLRRRQKTKRFRQRYRRRVVVEHRIGRLIQLGMRQARYLGRRKVGFQVALIATVANLTLLVGPLAAPGAGASLIAPLALLIAAMAVTFQLLEVQSRTPFQPSLALKFAPSRPGL